MKNSIKAGIILCLAVLLAFSLNAALAGNENATAAKNTTNVTENMTNVTKNMTDTNATMANVTENSTNPFAKVKGSVACMPDCTRSCFTDPKTRTQKCVCMCQ